MNGRIYVVSRLPREHDTGWRQNSCFGLTCRRFDMRCPLRNNVFVLPGSVQIFVDNFVVGGQLRAQPRLMLHHHVRIGKRFVAIRNNLSRNVLGTSNDAF